MDMLARLARTQREEEAIGAIVELFRMLFAPEAVHYLRVENEVVIPVGEVPPDTADALGEGLLASDPEFLFEWLEKKGANLLPGVKYEQITDDGLIVTTKDGDKKTLPADTIITALPLLPDDGLLKSLEGKVTEIYQIGDCRQAGFMPDAIADGWHTACAI